MKRTAALFASLLLLLSLSSFALAVDDVIIDESGNVTTGDSGGGNLEVTGASGEDAIVGSASGTGAAGVYGIRSDTGSYGILGYDSHGVFGYSPDGNAGFFQSPDGNAGYFQGNAVVTGTLSVGYLTGYTETDPQVGTLFNGRWCVSDGTVVNCDQAPPVLTETDPTVDANIKDGIDWTEVSGIPAGFADGIDNTGSTDLDWTINGSNMYSTVSGNVGIGKTDPASKLHVSHFFTAIIGERNKTGSCIPGPCPTEYGGYFTANMEEDKAVYGHASSTSNYTNYGGWFLAEGVTGIGVYGRATGSEGTGLYGKSYGDDGCGVFGVNISTSGDAKGVYGRAESVTGFGMYGVNIGTSGNSIGVYGRSNSLSGYGGYFKGKMAVQNNGTFVTRTEINGSQVNAYSGDSDIGVPLILNDISGQNVIVPAIEITGGADVAEPFEVADKQTIKPGMIVSIDPEHPGQLRIADRAYDRTVAGIVSGANGIKSGLTMSQEGSAADGSLPVALTGRVYAWADASKGAIKPGDMLTTSDSPGHAMKVDNYTKAQGAILGKAMSSLDEGKGLVLVLVTLQ